MRIKNNLLDAINLAYVMIMIDPGIVALTFLFNVKCCFCPRDYAVNTEAVEFFQQ